MTSREAARWIGADEETVRDWVRQYEVEGSAAFLPRDTNRNYNSELKEATVLEYLAGDGIQQDICHYIGPEVHKIYLSAILDLYDRRIVTYIIRDCNDNPLGIGHLGCCHSV